MNPDKTHKNVTLMFLDNRYSANRTFRWISDFNVVDSQLFSEIYMRNIRDRLLKHAYQR